MYFNRILNMPITNTTRCRIYNSPTSFMAKTYFDENGELKDSICVDVVECYISNNIKVVLNLLYNEEKELFTLKHSGQSYFYYLMFNICDLQEVLNMISAKSILYNKIFEVKECEYVDCEREDGYFVIDSCGSYFENDIQSKLESFTEKEQLEMFFKDENSKIDTKEILIEKSKYFIKIDNIIIHKSLYFFTTDTFIDCKNDIESFDTYQQQEISFDDIIKQYDIQPFEYAINSNNDTICALYNTKEKVCCFYGTLNSNNITDKVNELALRGTKYALMLNKEEFTERALTKVMDKVINKYILLKNEYKCTLTLQQVIEQMCSNNIFMLFDI